MKKKIINWFIHCCQMEVKIGDYCYLPVITLPSGTQRNIYYKVHKGKGIGQNTIFATNFPPFCPMIEIIRIFSQFGNIVGINHGSLNKEVFGKVKKPETIKQLAKIDLNMNINIGRSYKEDHDLRYKRINDINALEAKRAEIRRSIRNSLYFKYQK